MSALCSGRQISPEFHPVMVRLSSRSVTRWREWSGCHRDFAFLPRYQQLWVPLALPAEQREDRVSHVYGAIGRLRNGVSLAAAQTEMDAIVGFKTRLLEAIAALPGVRSTATAYNHPLGVYGVLSYDVAQRSHEIAVRVAIGARVQDVVGLVVGRGAQLTLVGLVLGLAGAAAVSRLMTSVLFEVSPLDAVTFIGVALSLSAVTLAASYVPARRAVKLDPITALRQG